jgi:S-formylglutathione hydrolase FrmB
MASRRLGRLAALITMIAVAVLALVCTVLSVPAWAEPTDKRALRILDQDQDGDQIRLKVFSPAMNRELPVTLLVPDDFDRQSSFPVLYALGGNEEGANADRAWLNSTDIRYAATHGALVVMPPTEKGGFFSDWYDGSRKWETFHTVELPALVRSKFKGTGKQAVMGISIGGHAALKYAAHHPGQYAAAAAYSGVLASSTPGMSSLYQATMRIAGQNPFSIWGDPVLQRAKWQYEDPALHLNGLRDTNLFISAAAGVPRMAGAAGDGTPQGRISQLSQKPNDGIAQTLAVANPAYETSVMFARKASAAGLNVTTSFPVRGVHNWSLWKDEFKVAWSEVLAPSLGLPR